MMKKIVLFTIILVSLTNINCKKDTDNTQPSPYEGFIGIVWMSDGRPDNTYSTYQYYTQEGSDFILEGDSTATAELLEEIYFKQEHLDNAELLSYNENTGLYRVYGKVTIITVKDGITTKEEDVGLYDCYFAKK